MAQSMKLFLIRHGETVDNVAQLYAGSRDSELTNHGYQQATRLGTHFQGAGFTFTHLFSSHLRRAAQTAGKIREAQLAATKPNTSATVPDVVQVPLLTEQDFGSLEGKTWLEEKNNRSGGTPWVDVETKDAMARRADEFLDKHFLPLILEPTAIESPVVAIVSHGIFLNTLWRRLLLRLEMRSVTLLPELQATARPSLEHLGGWSNTGFLELQLTNRNKPVDNPVEARGSTPDPPQPLIEATNDVENRHKTTAISKLGSDPAGQEPDSPVVPRIALGWTALILAINGKAHLQGLKRTGGGVGSSRHDASQKTIESFFKRRKVE